MKPFTQNIREEIVTSLKNGLSYREIARKYHCSIGVVTKIRKRFGILDSDIKKNKPLPQPKISKREKRRMLASLRSGDLENAVQRLQEMDGLSVSAVTVRRSLREGLRGTGKMKKHLTKHHMNLRLSFAKKFKDYTEEMWSRVIWSDQAKITAIQSDGKVWVLTGKKEPPSSMSVLPTSKCTREKIIIWGCMTSNGVGLLQRVQARMTSQDCDKILSQSLLGSLTKWGKTVDEVVFQQDNDRKHSVSLTEKWLSDQDFEVIEWPPNSSDLNPIHQLWGILKESIAEEALSLDDLWEKVKDEWDRTDPLLCENLVRSMPNRIKAVLEAKGGYTEY